jgi:hypothetical protein
MKHLFVPYEIAVELKKLGFNEPCCAFYSALSSEKRRFLWTKGDSITNSYAVNTITAVLYQQVIDWFRENHEIIIDPEYVALKRGEDLWRCLVYYYPKYKHKRAYVEPLAPEYVQEGYYKILEKAVRAAIELLKKSKA